MTAIKSIPVILASSRAEDQDNVRAALKGTPWEPVEAVNGAEAVKALHRTALPIIICDGELDGRSWQELLRFLLKARRRACIILLSEVDGPGNDEVIRRGGFDVVPRPAQKEDVLTALLCAYSQCRMNWLSFTRVPVHPETDEVRGSRRRAHTNSDMTEIPDGLYSLGQGSRVH